MGVPSFYRWLANKYPKILVNAAERTDDDGSLPNPNGLEFDNLYLDMNGIIHPCFHPQQDDILLHHLNNPVTYEEVFENIFGYIDRIMNIVRPRKLLYMAIDGVAPRAKMNQQRTRRFRSAKDLETLGKEEDRLRQQYQSEGRAVLPKEESEVSDSNVITPGTQFMYELSKQLQTYIQLRISKNSAWKQLKVILSNANVPGEGEHKIMSFIRLQRTCPDYNPNTSHVLYGLDADLIMLALATHEIHFSILRENVLMQDHNAVHSLSEKSEAGMAKSGGGFKQFDLNEQMNGLDISAANKRKSFVKKPFQFLHVWILREYLKLDIEITNPVEKFEADFERIIDDFIFICFFAGNDFLLHMPTLEIHEGAIDLLIHVYKEEFKNLGGYLVDMQRVEDCKRGYIKLKRVEKFILSVGAYEDKIFKKRSEIQERKLKRVLSDIEDARENAEYETCTTDPSLIVKDLAAVSDVPLRCNDNDDIIENTKMLKDQLKSYTCEVSDVFRNGLLTDKIKLGAPGFKKRYYQYKFSANSEEEMENTRRDLVAKYTEGLCWVLRYYFSGVPSWTWFFPYHYGPFASDMKGLSHTKMAFKKGLPFKPFDQLMAVLPPMSAHALPPSYQSLMSDKNSEILGFYPSEFEVDTDGKRFLWQGICKLPFIDEDCLLVATKKIEQGLSEEEASRNAENVEQLFVHSLENLALKIMSICNNESLIKRNEPIKIDISGNINGFVRPKLLSQNIGGSTGLENDQNALCLFYYSPSFSVHIPRILEGTNIPETNISEVDIEESQLWHNNQGYHCPNNSHRAYWNKNQNVVSRNSCPGGAGSRWNVGAGGRGNTHDLSSRSSQQQRQVTSSWDTHGRGSRQNGNGRSSGSSGQWSNFGSVNSQNSRKWSATNGLGFSSQSQGHGPHRRW